MRSFDRGGRPTARLGPVLVACLLALVFGVTTAPMAAAALADHLWTRTMTIGTAAEVDAFGNTTLFSTFFGTIDLGGGPMTAVNNLTGDVYLARFDAAGSHLWSRQFTPINQAGLFDLHLAVSPEGAIFVSGMLFGSDLDFGGGVLSGATEDLGVLAHFDQQGNHVWSFGIGNGTVLDLAATSDRILGVGDFSEGSGIDLGGSLLTTAGAEDIFAFALATDGTHLWSQRFGDADRQSSNAVAVDRDGNVVLAGANFGSVDFGGGPLTASGVDYYVTKLDPDGAHLWDLGVTGTVGSGASIRPYLDLATGPSGEVVFAGEFRTDIDLGGGSYSAAGSFDAFVARYDSGGNHVWSARYGDTGPDRALSVDLDNAGNVLLVGTFDGPVDFGGGALTTVGTTSNFFVAVFGPSGAHTFSRGYGAGILIEGSFDDDSDIRLHGYGADADFGGGPIGYESFVVKLDGTLNTPVGSSVPVSPLDPVTGVSPVAMNFDSITADGITSLVTSSSGPPPPNGLSFGSMATYYDLSTTASYTGSIEVCIQYDENDIPGAEADLTLQHYDAAVPGWVDITTSVDTVNDVLCGSTTSLSPFAIAAPEGATGIASPPPSGFALVGAQPNPFNPRTSIVFEVSAGGGHVELELFDARGRRVDSLLSQPMDAGRHSVTWDGRTIDGAEAPSGVYFARLRAGAQTQTLKLVLLR